MRRRTFFDIFEDDQSDEGEDGHRDIMIIITVKVTNKPIMLELNCYVFFLCMLNINPNTNIKLNQLQLNWTQKYSGKRRLGSQEVEFGWMNSMRAVQMYFVFRICVKFIICNYNKC